MHAIAEQVAQLAREIPDRPNVAGRVGESTLREFVDALSGELRTGILMTELRDKEGRAIPYDPLMHVPTVRVLGREHPSLVRSIHLLERGELYKPRQRMSPALPASLAKVTEVPAELSDAFTARNIARRSAAVPGSRLHSAPEAFFRDKRLETGRILHGLA